MKYAIVILALVGCQQQPASITSRPCPEACECDLCKCKEPCSCGTEVAKNIESLRESVYALERRLADRQTVSSGSVRRVEATPPKQYTGIAVYVAEVAATIQERSTCEPCNRLVRDVRSFGTGWRVGGLADHFAILQADPGDYTPLIVAYRDGVEVWRETGYAGDVDSLLRRHPKVEPRSLLRSSSAIAEGVPLPSVYTGGSSFYSSPLPVYQYQSAPAFSWGVQFGQPAYRSYGNGYSQCVNGICN